MLLSKALEGYYLNARAGSISSSTLVLYWSNLRNFQRWMGDVDIADITSDDLVSYMAWLRNDYKPVRKSGNQSPLSPAALDNYRKSVRSFFAWANADLDLPRPDDKMPKVRYRDPDIVPYTVDELRRILNAAGHVNFVKQGKHVRQRLPLWRRNEALILTLLDTGMRRGEITRLLWQDVNLEVGEIYVRAFESGKKSKPRTVRVGKVARKDLWRLRAENDAQGSESTFGMNANGIQIFLRRTGKRANVQECRAHRFRHTFAIEYLRGSGDIFTLRDLLGHSTFDMVNRYLAIAKSDIEAAHRRASPTDRIFNRRR